MSWAKVTWVLHSPQVKVPPENKVAGSNGIIVEHSGQGMAGLDFMVAKVGFFRARDPPPARTSSHPSINHPTPTQPK